MWFFPCCTPDSMYDLLMWNSFEEIQEPFSLQTIDFGAPPVVNTLSDLWRPLIAKGTLRKQDFEDAKLFKESSFEKVDVEGLVATIQKIRCPTSPEQVGTFSVSSNLLGKELLDRVANSIGVSKAFTNQAVELKKKLLVIYTSESRNFHRFPRSETSVGTVEVILNSAFTGGELQVRCDGDVANLNVVPYDWVAVHTDAACSVSPVTSGARVSLIYDLVTVVNADQPVLAVVDHFQVVPWRDKIFDGLSLTCNTDIDYLVTIAQDLRPDMVGKRNVILDAQVLNLTSLNAIAKEAEQSGYLGRFFPNRALDIRATHLAIHRTDECGAKGNSYVWNERGKGYLGTLVVLWGIDTRAGILFSVVSARKRLV